jgi:phosphohistidine phosphatase
MKGLKRIYFIRHAKSSWANPLLSDFERPLNKRGREAAKIMGEKFKCMSIQPDLVFCSPAERTKKTLDLLMHHAQWKADLRFEPDLYLASPNRLLCIAQQAPDGVQSLVLLGHNPGLEDLIRSIQPLAHPKFPTLGVVACHWTVASWKDVNIENAHFDWFDYPKKTP